MSYQWLSFLWVHSGFFSILGLFKFQISKKKIKTFLSSIIEIIHVHCKKTNLSISIIPYAFLKNTYWFIWKSFREREVFHLLFHSPNGHTGRVGLGWSQAPATPCRSSVRVAAAQSTWAIFSSLPRWTAGSCIKREGAGLNPVLQYVILAAQAVAQQFCGCL